MTNVAPAPEAEALPPRLEKILQETMAARGLDVEVAHQILAAVLKDPQDVRARIIELLEGASQ